MTIFVCVFHDSLVLLIYATILINWWPFAKICYFKRKWKSNQFFVFVCSGSNEVLSPLERSYLPTVLGHYPDTVSGQPPLDHNALQMVRFGYYFCCLSNIC